MRALVAGSDHPGDGTGKRHDYVSRLIDVAAILQAHRCGNRALHEGFINLPLTPYRIFLPTLWETKVSIAEKRVRRKLYGDRANIVLINHWS